MCCTCPVLKGPISVGLGANVGALALPVSAFVTLTLNPICLDSGYDPVARSS
jgi:hypothetical protein